MLFNSYTFLAFLVLVWGIYRMFVGRGPRVRNAILLAASYWFYGAWDIRFLSLIVISSAADYLVGLKLAGSASPSSRKAWLALSLSVNLGLLAYFKYANFFLDSLQSLLIWFGFSGELGSLEIILPVGISFYTFQTLSYSLDIYYRRMQPTRDILAFFTFVAFFPQLVAGPVERASHLLPQFLHQAKPVPDIRRGLAQMLQGFLKKLVIADALAPWVDRVYADPSQWSGPVIFLATLGFALQIYADFSGYSDIAIGVARLFGMELRTNFRRPYFARSLQEFWTRWHISLSTWFRDYVYIPLGGNRGGAAKWMRNIAITFLVSGLWHGANWTFVVWGALHGLGYLIESRFRLPGPIQWVWTMLIVLIGWMFFRASSVTEAVEAMQALVNLAPRNGLTAWYTTTEWLVPGWIMLGSIILWLGVELRREFMGKEPGYVWPLWQYYLLFGWILLAGAFGQPQAFIYFQF